MLATSLTCQSTLGSGSVAGVTRFPHDYPFRLYTFKLHINWIILSHPGFPTAAHSLPTAVFLNELFRF